jgi:hypothetical protein
MAAVAGAEELEIEAGEGGRSGWLPTWLWFTSRAEAERSSAQYRGLKRAPDGVKTSFIPDTPHHLYTWVPKRTR